MIPALLLTTRNTKYTLRKAEREGATRRGWQRENDTDRQNGSDGERGADKSGEDERQRERVEEVEQK